MLTFTFRKEWVGDDCIFRPRLTLCLFSDLTSVEASALLDSGADRSIIPLELAERLELKKQRIVNIGGIGGKCMAYESYISFELYDIAYKISTVQDLPVYVVDGITDVVIGRMGFFDIYKIKFEKMNNRILLMPT